MSQIITQLTDDISINQISRDKDTVTIKTNNAYYHFHLLAPGKLDYCESETYIVRELRGDYTTERKRPATLQLPDCLINFLQSRGFEIDQ